MSKQAKTIAKLVRDHGQLYADLDRETGNVYLGTADAIEYAVHLSGRMRVNYVHPNRCQPDRIAGLLAA